MSEHERRLLAILKDRSFETGRPGGYPLASGDISPYYIDGKMTTTFSEGAYLIGEVLYARTKDLDIDAIGGLEVGAVPLTTAVVMSYHRHGSMMEGFWVRDKAKKHGTGKLIEGGGIREGARVVIVDDVFTRGGSALKAVRAVQEAGCQVVMVLALVDRLAGARELFQRNGIDDYRAVFTIRDFGIDTNVCEPTEATTR